MKYAYCAGQGSWGTCGAGLAGPPRKFCQQPCLQFSVLLAPPLQHSLLQRAGLSWPLLAPSSEDRDWPGAVPESPSSPQTCTGDIKFSLSCCHYRVMVRGASAVLAASNRMPAQLRRVPQRARPPIVHTLPTALDCVLRLLASWADQVPACPPQSPPSAPMSSDPPFAHLAVSSAGLPKKAGFIHMYTTVHLASFVTCRSR